MREALYQPTVNDYIGWYNVAQITIEAMLDDVMEADEQDMKISSNLDSDKMEYTVTWKWENKSFGATYENKKTFKLDENLEVNLKAYMFDLIIMTRNL